MKHKLTSSMSLYDFDQQFLAEATVIAGVDEAGRGPLAGPLVVSACVLDNSKPINGLNDSKQLTEHKRDTLYQEITTTAIAFSLVVISVEEIDSLNILGATMQGMRMALEQLPILPQLALIDGNRIPSGLSIPAKSIIKGDSHSAAIAAASILAKVTRDRLMLRLDEMFPEYGFSKHKGYPTKEHLKSLRIYGASDHHRRSFRPVRMLTEEQLEITFV